MAADQVDYKGVLADLKARRAALDQAIAAIEASAHGEALWRSLDLGRNKPCPDQRPFRALQWHVARLLFRAGIRLLNTSVHTVTRTGSVVKWAHCEHCGADFVYQMQRTAAGYETSFAFADGTIRSTIDGANLFFMNR